jgi:ferrous iron transport protein A
MGLLPGKEVKFNYRAPLGDPISVQISGYNLSLRLDEASQVEIL